MNRKWIIPVIAAAFLCTSCALFPEEEVLPEAPVLREAGARNYTQVEVLRGDLVAKTRIICKYQPAVEEALHFPMSDEIISQAYVKQGDEVTAGTLLMELENSDLHRQIEAQQETLDLLNLQITQTDEKLGLYYERCALLDRASAVSSAYSYQSEAADRTCLQLYEELEYLNKLLEVEQMAMDELQQELSQRQIYATMDGTVTYVAKPNADRRWTTTAGVTMCKVSDLTTSSFAAEVTKGILKKGDSVIITYNEADHEAKVTGVTPHAKKEDMEKVTFQLEILDADLSTETKGEVIVETGRKENVLYLPESAVVTLDRVEIVYYLDENGIKDSKVVETGMEANGYIEIVSGLEEGEMVIK